MEKLVGDLQFGAEFVTFLFLGTPLWSIFFGTVSPLPPKKKIDKNCQEVWAQHSPNLCLKLVCHFNDNLWTAV